MRWFAGYPVLVEIVVGKRRTIRWLCYVQRIWRGDHYSYHPTWYVGD